ncbi:MAG: hypothetical protein IPL99_01295 [Candidatus Competibacteraceae bacterium]|nr:hypothetical protein [Candidatus Competibacteraceae bacterium]
MRKILVSSFIGFYLAVLMLGTANSADILKSTTIDEIVTISSACQVAVNTANVQDKILNQAQTRKNIIIAAKGNHCGYLCRTYTDCGDNDGNGITEDVCHYCVDRICRPHN